MSRVEFRAIPIDKPKDSGEFVYGWLCIWQGTVLIFDSPFNLLHHPVEVHPNTVQTEVCGEWFTEKELSDTVKKGLTSDGE